MKQSRVVLGLAVLALVAIGFVVLSSAGGPVGLRKHHDLCFFMKQQAKWLALSLPLFWGPSCSTTASGGSIPD